MSDQNVEMAAAVNNLNNTLGIIPDALQKIREQITVSFKENNTIALKELLEKSNKQLVDLLKKKDEKEKESSQKPFSSDFFTEIYQKLGILKPKEEKKEELFDEKDRLLKAENEGQKVSLLGITEPALEKLSSVLRKSVKEALQDFTTSNPGAFCCSNSNPDKEGSSDTSSSGSGSSFALPLIAAAASLAIGTALSKKETNQTPTINPIGNKTKSQPPEPPAPSKPKPDITPAPVIPSKAPEPKTETVVVPAAPQVKPEPKTEQATPTTVPPRVPAPAGTESKKEENKTVSPTPPAPEIKPVPSLDGIKKEEKEPLPLAAKESATKPLPLLPQNAKESTEVVTKPKETKTTIVESVKTVPYQPQLPLQTSLNGSTTKAVVSNVDSVPEKKKLEVSAVNPNIPAPKPKEGLDKIPGFQEINREGSMPGIEDTDLAKAIGVTGAIAAAAILMRGLKLPAPVIVTMLGAGTSAASTPSQASNNKLNSAKPSVEPTVTSPLRGVSKQPEETNETNAEKNTVNSSSISPPPFNYVAPQSPTNLFEMSNVTLPQEDSSKKISDSLMLFGAKIDEFLKIASRGSTDGEGASYNNISSNKSNITTFNSYSGAGDEINSSRLQTEQKLLKYRYQY